MNEFCPTQKDSICIFDAFRGSTKKLFSEDLSGILQLGFQQNSVFQEFVGHIAFGLPTGFKFQGTVEPHASIKSK